MATLLLDENLPEKLCPILSSFGLDVVHVQSEGFIATADSRIWDHAVENDFVIVTKDADYLDLAAITGKGRVILLGIGNMRLRELYAFVTARAEAITDFATGEERVLIINRT